MKKIIIVLLALASLCLAVYLYKQQNTDLVISERKVNLIGMDKAQITNIKPDMVSGADTIDLMAKEQILTEQEIKDLNDTVRPERVLDYISSFNGLFGDPKKIKKGEDILVNSYYENEDDYPDFLTIPIFEDNKVVSLVVYYPNSSGEFLMGAVTDVRGYNWGKYPPISRSEAKQKINKKYKKLKPYKKAIDYFHIGGEEPLYAFKSKEIDGIITVGSHNGYVREITSKIPTPPKEQNSEEKTLNIQVSEDGHVKFSKEDALYQGMSDKEIRKAELTIIITNYLIDDGVMKLNDLGEVDEDNRTPEIIEQFNEVMDEFDKSDGEDTELFEKYFN